MKLKHLLIAIISLFSQFSFSQKYEDIKYDEAKEAYRLERYIDAKALIEEVKGLYKSVPPKVAYLEILIKKEIIQTDFFEYSLLANTRNLIDLYQEKYFRFKNDNYNEVVKIKEQLKKYPSTLAEYNLQKEAMIQEKLLKKENEQRLLLEAKEKKELEIKKQQEQEKIDLLIIERKRIIEPFKKAVSISDYYLGRLSESEFATTLNQAKIDIIKIQQEEAKNEIIRNKRLKIIEPYIQYVNSYDLNNLGSISQSKFDDIYKIARKYDKDSRKYNRSQIGSFASIGYQGGEIATYGFIYERGGKNTVGFRLSGRSSLLKEEDILFGSEVKNKTEIELGPNFKIFKRLYLNIGGGYGYYDKIIQNDYAGTVELEKTGYVVATTGLMFRLSKVININGGASFMDIDKDFYKPEITFGISFNLKGKNRR